MGASRQGYGMQPRLARLVRVFRRIADSVEKPAHQAVAMFAPVAYPADDAPQRYSEQHQGVRGKHQARLEGLWDDLCRPRGNQPIQVRVVEGPHDYRKGRIQRTYVVQDPQRNLGI